MGTDRELDIALCEERYTRGSGWWLGVVMSKLPLGVTRVVWVLMGIGICALGVLELAGSR